MEKKIHVGIGFATGRKSFQKVLRTYISNWVDSGLADNNRISLNVFVAYDLSYHKTKVRDYTNVHPDCLEHIDSITFIGERDIQKEVDHLVDVGSFKNRLQGHIFQRGYAGKRNAVLYFAIKNKMDYLIFLDDDEYPVTVTNTRKTAVWGGQHVVSMHLENIPHADITHGHHCGYISPIPYIEYNECLHENDFKIFIEAISNDIVNWDKIKKVMENGGVTYGDTKVLISNEPYEVMEESRCKFISGSNLCINLTKPERTFAFYNPPNARGEDTFLSTLLSERRVLRVPCYTFHDGFSTYNCLTDGVLPIKLKFITSDSDLVKDRFLRACIGWIRYKPLFLAITSPNSYDERIRKMRSQLVEVLPKICIYFKDDGFMAILKELDKYHRNVKKHYDKFRETQDVWKDLMRYASDLRQSPC